MERKKTQGNGSDATDPKSSSCVLGPAFTKTLLETALPFRELSLLAKADQRATDPVYTAHRWWARRPPGVMRGLLLAAALPESSEDQFWRCFSSDRHSLSGVSVLDPFLGGGTTAVEAARLGGVPHGYDVDPLSTLIVKHELAPADPRELEVACQELLAYLRSETGDLYLRRDKGFEPLHYFHLHQVTCPKCCSEALLYRSLVLARDVKKPGAVVRDAATVAFCPLCLDIRELRNKSQAAFRCCGRLHKLNSGNYTCGRFKCARCGTKSQHAELRTGVARRKLIAVEETAEGAYRRIRRPSQEEFKAEERAATRFRMERSHLDLPKVAFETTRRDSRPISFGAARPVDLFSERQLLTFGYAFRWARRAVVSEQTRNALLLSLSNALTTNNKLCGYATDYGRLAPLFSVRSYSLPLLPVELNPLHESGGRGTLARAFARTIASAARSVRRYVWSKKRRRALPAQFAFAPNQTTEHILCASAEAPPEWATSRVEICVFDPPYFDFISYSELSEFYRAWLSREQLGGLPLLPNNGNPVASFGMRFARALRATLARLEPGRPLAFTYHAGRKEAWEAVALGLDNAGLLITALWPVRNDGHMGHHTAAGNCEWDAIVVCRRASECARVVPSLDVRAWKDAVRPLAMRKADVEALQLAATMASQRFGEPKGSGGDC